jgi:hypothetical protein
MQVVLLITRRSCRDIGLDQLALINTLFLGIFNYVAYK